MTTEIQELNREIKFTYGSTTLILMIDTFRDYYKIYSPSEELVSIESNLLSKVEETVKCLNSIYTYLTDNTAFRTENPF